MIGLPKGHLILGDNAGPAVWVGAPPPLEASRVWRAILDLMGPFETVAGVL